MVTLRHLCCSACLRHRGNDVQWLVGLHSPTQRHSRWQYDEAAHWFCVWLTDRPRYLPTGQFSPLRPYLRRRQEIWSQRGSEKRGGNREENSSAALHKFHFLHYSCRRRCFSTCNICGSGPFFYFLVSCFRRLEEPRTRRSPVEWFSAWHLPSSMFEHQFPRQSFPLRPETPKSQAATQSATFPLLGRNAGVFRKSAAESPVPHSHWGAD